MNATWKERERESDPFSLYNSTPIVEFYENPYNIDDDDSVQEILLRTQINKYHSYRNYYYYIILEIAKERKKNNDDDDDDDNNINVVVIYERWVNKMNKSE